MEDRAPSAVPTAGGAYGSAVPQYIDPTGPVDPERGIRFALHTVHPDTPVLTGLLEAAARGEQSTTVEATYPLADAAQAHHRQARGGLRGKVVLVP